MEINLDKQDLIALVKGQTPNYSVMDDPEIKRNGRYTGGFHDKWDWESYNLEKESEDTLYSIYNKCKNSWK